MMTSPVGGIDPHQDSFTIGIVHANGVELTHDSFPNTAVGFFDSSELLTAHGVEQVGVEGSASWGSHIAIALVAAGFDAREVPPQRSAAQRRHADWTRPTSLTLCRRRGRCSPNQPLARFRHWRSTTR